MSGVAGMLSTVEDATTQVDGTVMCEVHARDALRRKRES
jgi:hypothetical protein